VLRTTGQFCGRSTSVRRVGGLADAMPLAPTSGGGALRLCTTSKGMINPFKGRGADKLLKIWPASFPTECSACSQCQQLKATQTSANPATSIHRYTARQQGLFWLWWVLQGSVSAQHLPRLSLCLAGSCGLSWPEVIGCESHVECSSNAWLADSEYGLFWFVLR
jgi:hypothetical protein